MTEVSSTRLYLGNLPRNATKADVEAHFQTHGTGEITEIKLMNGFGFIEYKDAMDARDVVPGKFVESHAIRGSFANMCQLSVCIVAFDFRIHHLTALDGSDFMGERLIVQFARGSRRNENFTPHERAAPRPRRTPFRMRISNLPVETSWQVRDPDDFGCPVFPVRAIHPQSGKASFTVFMRFWIWTPTNSACTGSEGLCPSVWIGRGLFRSWPRARWNWVSPLSPI